MQTEPWEGALPLRHQPEVPGAPGEGYDTGGNPGRPLVTRLPPQAWAALAALLTGLCIVVDPRLAAFGVIGLVAVVVSLSHFGFLLSVLLGLMLLRQFQVLPAITLGGLPLSLSKLAALMAVLVFTGDALVRRKTVFVHHPVFYALLLINVCYVVAALASDRPEESIYSIQRMFMMTTLSYMAFRFVDISHLRAISFALPIIMAVATTLNLWDASQGGVWSRGSLISGGNRVVRGSGTFEDPNEWATVNLTLLPLLIFQMRQQRATWLKVAHAAVIGGVIVNVVLSFSRAGLLAFGMLGLLLLWNERRNLLRATLAGVAGLAIALAVATPELVMERAQTLLVKRSSDADGSLSARYYLLTNGLRAFVEHPVWGVGPGQFRLHVRFGGGVGDLGKVAHNTYLSLSVELGLWGILAFGWLFYQVVRTALWCRQHVTDPWLLKYLGAGTLSVAAFCMMGLTLNLETEAWAWFLLGTGLALPRIARESGALVQAPAGAS